MVRPASCQPLPRRQTEKTLARFDAKLRQHFLRLRPYSTVALNNCLDSSTARLLVSKFSISVLRFMQYNTMQGSKSKNPIIPIIQPYQTLVVSRRKPNQRQQEQASQRPCNQSRARTISTMRKTQVKDQAHKHSLHRLHQEQPPREIFLIGDAETLLTLFPSHNLNAQRPRHQHHSRHQRNGRHIHRQASL